jgi:phosphatidylserine/phosphatidylglycerophosphate/cardiolipin synthase-like enzyme
MGNYYINTRGESKLTDHLKSLIASANSYIKICSFLMQDRDTVELLQEKSIKGEAAIFVLSNLRSSDYKKEEYLSSDEDYESDELDKYNFDAHYELLQNLYKAGIHVRLLNDLHAKFIIVDGIGGLLMSANISPNSLSNNVETGMSLSTQDIKSLEYIFDVMYCHADIQKYTDYKQKDIIVSNKSMVPEDAFKDLKGNIRLTACPFNNVMTNLSELQITTIYNEIISIIKNANNFLYIVSWEFKDRRNILSEFRSEVKRAIARGVEVSLFFNRKGPIGNLKAQDELVRRLINVGCSAYTDECNHSKCIISEKEGMLFTANIDGNIGLKSGFEVGCLFDSEQLNAATQHIRSLIKFGQEYKGLEYGNNE